jgi:hypothetical protein
LIATEGTRFGLDSHQCRPARNDFSLSHAMPPHLRTLCRPAQYIIRSIIPMFSRKSRRRAVAEHWQTALRLGLGCLVLDHVPMIGETTIFYPDDIRGYERRMATVA